MMKINIIRMNCDKWHFVLCVMGDKPAPVNDNSSKHQATVAY